MKRHFAKKLVPEANWSQSVTDNSEQTDGEDLLWELPPYVLAKFSGELAKVMLESAEHYVHQQIYSRAREKFEEIAFQSEPSQQVFSENTKKNET